MQVPTNPRSRERSRLLTAAALGLLLLLAGAAWLLSDEERPAETLANAEAAAGVEESSPAARQNTEHDSTEANAVSPKTAAESAVQETVSAQETAPAQETAAAPQTSASNNESTQPPTATTTEQSSSAPSRPHIDLSRLLSDKWEMQRAYGFDYNPNSEDYRFHRGCDLSAASGQPVFAPTDGVVREADEDAYWGGFIILDCPGWTAILRCVTPRVESGKTVKAGEFIGSVCNSPAEAAQEPHLHVEAETDGESFDPSLYF